MAATARRPKTLPPVRPNAAVEEEYRRRLERLIDEMHRSVRYWVRAAYRRRPPELHRLHAALAQDDSPVREIMNDIRFLGRRWLKRFNAMAQDLASYFATRVADRSAAQLATILRDGGISVKFTTTRAVNDVLQAAIAENVALIKSIPQRYLSEVEGAVARSVARGRDLASLTDELEERYQVTRKRAAFIARDQNAKASSAIVHARYAELNIKSAVWVHSGGGKHPRPTHLKAGRDKVEYDITTGWFDPHEQKYIFPGELIQCRCVARPVTSGLS